MSEQMQDNESESRQEESKSMILTKEVILNGTQRYIVTMEKINVSIVFVISDVTESNTNRRIIVPMTDYKPFMDLIDHILSIRIDTKDMNKVNICGFPNPQKMKTEDGRNFYYIIYVNDEIYFVTIYQIEERRHTFLTIDFTSLKSVQLSIKAMEIYFRDLIPENSSHRNCVNLQRSDRLIGNSILGSAEDDSESNAYRE